MCSRNPFNNLPDEDDPTFHNRPRRGGFEPIPEWREPCSHPSHQPPTMIVIPKGQRYRHVCPHCGAESILMPTEATLCAAGNRGAWML